MATRFWAEVTEDSICFNLVGTDDDNFVPQNDWIEYNPEADVVAEGMKYQDGTWVEIQE